MPLSASAEQALKSSLVADMQLTQLAQGGRTMVSREARPSPHERVLERNARAQAPILILALLHGADGFPRDEAMVCLVREDCQDEPRRPRANVLAHTMHEQLDMRELIVGRYARKNRADR